MTTDDIPDGFSPPDAKPRFCVDCRWLMTPGMTCSAPTPRDGYDLVTGDKLKPLVRYYEAYVERASDRARINRDPEEWVDLCGPSGRFFEPKTEEGQ